MQRKICEWCENEIEPEIGEIEVDGMHEVCHRAAHRQAMIEDQVAKDYDPQS